MYDRIVLSIGANLSVRVTEEGPGKTSHCIGRIPFHHRDTVKFQNDLADLFIGFSLTAGTSRDNQEMIDRLRAMTFIWKVDGEILSDEDI